MWTPLTPEKISSLITQDLSIEFLVAHLKEFNMEPNIRQNHLKKVIEQEIIAEKTIKRRNCLKCQNIFTSEGIFNRICNLCKTTSIGSLPIVFEGKGTC